MIEMHQVAGIPNDLFLQELQPLLDRELGEGFGFEPDEFPASAVAHSFVPLCAAPGPDVGTPYSQHPVPVRPPSFVSKSFW